MRLACPAGDVVMAKEVLNHMDRLEEPDGGATERNLHSQVNFKSIAPAIEENNYIINIIKMVLSYDY